MAGSDSLNGKAISDTYKDLLQVPNANSGVDGTLRTVMDGEGTESTLQVSTAGVKSTGTLESTGNLTVGGTLTLGGTAISSLEDGATADQTGAEIKTAYEGEADTNAFTDADHSKLDGIEPSATANDTDANLKDRANHTGTQAASTISDFDTEVANNTAVAANTAKVTNATHTGDVTGDTALTIADSAVTTAKIADDAVTAAKLNAALNDLSNVNASPSDGQVLKWVNASSEWQAADDTGGGSSGGISNVSEDTTPQLGGDLDVNGNSIVSASNGDIAVTPNGTGKVILDGLNWPTADGSADQVLKTDGSGQLSFTAAGGSGTVTSVAISGSDGIDVDSGSPITSSGTIALGLSNIGDAAISSASTWNGKIANVSEDTTPQLGGDLDVNGQDIVSTSNADIEIAPNGTGATVFKGNTNAGAIKLNCESNSHGQTVIAQPHSAGVTNTLTLPAGSNQEIVGTSATQTLTNKTIGVGQLSGTVAIANGGTNASDASTARTNLGLGAAAEKAFDTAGGVQAYDADTTKNDVSNTWTAAQQGNTQTAAFSALTVGSDTGVLDFDTYQNFVITLGAGTNAFTNPTTDAGNTGQTGVIVLIQDSSASTATWTSDYKNVGGSAPTLSSGSSKVDVLPYVIQADNTILLGTPQLDFS